MQEEIETILHDARTCCVQGRRDEAERAYARAAELARLDENMTALAHSLRHMSQLALERGATADARERACEAVALYLDTDDRGGLANAVRLQALSAASPAEAKGCWQRARNLYSSLGIAEGVNECDGHLRG